MSQIIDLLKRNGPLTAEEIKEMLGDGPRIMKQITDAKKKAEEVGLKDLPMWSPKLKRYVSLYYLDYQLQEAATKACFVSMDEKDSVSSVAESKESATDFRREVRRIVDLLESGGYEESFKEEMADHLFALSQSRTIEDEPELLELYKKTIERKISGKSTRHAERVLAAFHNSLRRILEDKELRDWFLNELYDEIRGQFMDGDLDEEVRLARLRELEWVSRLVEAKRREIYESVLNVCLDKRTAYESNVFGESKHKIVTMVLDSELEELMNRLSELAKKNRPKDTRKKAQDLIKEIYTTRHRSATS